jgi:hypothetical protein
LAVSDPVPAVRRSILFNVEKQGLCLQHTSRISPHAALASNDLNDVPCVPESTASLREVSISVQAPCFSCASIGWK